MATHRRATPQPTLTPEQRQQIAGLLDAVPAAAAESDPRFLQLLDGWAACRVEYPVFIRAYRCKGGGWLTAGVAAVIADIRAHVGAAGGF